MTAWRVQRQTEACKSISPKTFRVSYVFVRQKDPRGTHARRSQKTRDPWDRLHPRAAPERREHLGYGTSHPIHDTSVGMIVVMTSMNCTSCEATCKSPLIGRLPLRRLHRLFGDYSRSCNGASQRPCIHMRAPGYGRSVVQVYPAGGQSQSDADGDFFQLYRHGSPLIGGSASFAWPYLFTHSPGNASPYRFDVLAIPSGLLPNIRTTGHRRSSSLPS